MPHRAGREQAHARLPEARHEGAGILLLSLATLLLELSLTRVLSVSLWYHFGFLVVSTALLGFGASGVVLAVTPRLREHPQLHRMLGCIALCFGATTLLCFRLSQVIPFDPLTVLADRRQLLWMPLYYVVLATPFFCSGLALALLFTRRTADIGRLYALDLIGAGAGCAVLAVIMPAVGGSGTVMVSAALGFVAAATFAWREARRMALGALVLAAAAGALSTQADTLLPITITPLKLRPPGPPILTAWNTFSRIDVWERHVGPADGGTTVRRFVFDGGTAATGLQALRPDARTWLRANTADEDYPSGSAYAGKTHPAVLVIGSGGGAEVLAALHFGARSVTAVEVNPIITEAVSTSMREHWGGLFDLPEVHLVTGEGRSVVRRSHEKYDAIVSVHTISNAAVASGALALAENFVLTREAFEDYLDHLTPDGVIYFTRPEAQIARLVATAREALQRRHVADASAHVYAYRVPPDSGESAYFGQHRPAFEAGVFIKRSPFSSTEIVEMERRLGVNRPPRNPPSPAPVAIYSPLEHTPGIYLQLLTAPDLESLYRTSPQQLEPATDDRPFFNHVTRWSSLDRRTLAELFGQQRLGNYLLGDRPVAEVALLLLLAQVTIIAAVFMLLPLTRVARSARDAPHRAARLGYFAALGLGFIMVEIALLSRFTVFLGQPVYTFAVVLASLLVFTGVGSALSQRFHAAPLALLQRALPGAVAVIALTALAIPVLFDAALGLSLLARVVIAVAVLAPLGVTLGIPLPTGLRLLDHEATALVPWAWGVNGFFTVIGTVLALIAGMTFGFRFVLVTGAACYVLAWLLAGRLGVRTAAS